MTWLEKVEQAGMSIIVVAIGTISGGVGWMIRRVLTNAKELELLTAEITRRDANTKYADMHRDKQRDEDREVVKDIQRKVDMLYERGQT